MPKIITSPVDRWPGTVTIADPMTMPQVLAFEDALSKRSEFFEERDGQRLLKVNTLLGGPDAEGIAAILPCVESWEIEGFPKKPTEKNFPSSPRGDSHVFIQWLFGEILNVYAGETDIPNE